MEYDGIIWEDNRFLLASEWRWTYLKCLQYGVWYGFHYAFGIFSIIHCIILMQWSRSGTKIEVCYEQQKRKSRIWKEEESAAPHMQLQNFYELPAQNENILQQ